MPIATHTIQPWTLPKTAEIDRCDSLITLLIIIQKIPPSTRLLDGFDFSIIIFSFFNLVWQNIPLFFICKDKNLPLMKGGSFMRSICFILRMVFFMIFFGCKAEQAQKPKSRLFSVGGELYYVEEGKPPPWSPQGKRPRSWWMLLRAWQKYCLWKTDKYDRLKQSIILAIFFKKNTIVSYDWNARLPSCMLICFTVNEKKNKVCVVAALFFSTNNKIVHFCVIWALVSRLDYWILNSLF